MTYIVAAADGEWHSMPLIPREAAADLIAGLAERPRATAFYYNPERGGWVYTTGGNGKRSKLRAIP